MEKFKFDDTITAVSTPAGTSGIGIVRISGKDALKVADKVFLSKDNKKPSTFKTYTTHYGWIVDGSQPALASYTVGPRKSDVIDEVLDYYRARLPRMGKSVVIEGNYQGLRPVKGNSELLNWAFENLVKNSLSAIGSVDGKISVSGAMSKNFRQVILDFTDNGKGIAYSDQKRIMKPGFTTKKRGWGLGLSLVKRIIEDYHGGKVYLLESREGVGTTIRVVLPSTDESAEESPENCRSQV